MNLYDLIFNLTSAIIALVSLVISVVALKIARETFLFSSKDFIPIVDFDFKDEDLIIYNRSRKHFEVVNISLLLVEKIGFYETDVNTMVQMPFLTRSVSDSWFERTGRDKKVIKIPADQVGACAFGICPYDPKLVKEIRSMQSSLHEHGIYAAPHLQGRYYVVNLLFKDRFLDSKSTTFVYEHFHGYGYAKRKIDENILEAVLAEINIPKFATSKELWDYMITKYRRKISVG